MAKKNRSTKLFLLSLILLALCGGTYLAMEFLPEPVEDVIEEENSVKSETILGLASTSFDTVEVINSKGNLVFVREDDG